MKGRYSPVECIGTRKRKVEGGPDPKPVSTSYVERQNLTMHVHAPVHALTNAFSKKLDDLSPENSSG